MKPIGSTEGDSPLTRAFAGLFGAFLGLSLLKYGNPPIMEKWVEKPANIYEFLLGFPWPIDWAYWMLGLLVVAGVLGGRFIKPRAPAWLIALPAAWLLWQFLAAAGTVDARLTRATVSHFVACVVCFYLGCFCLGRTRRLTPFWLGLLAGFLPVLAVGWQQHFGGLEETRRYFFLYIYPQAADVPPEYLKKMSSTRVFSTLFYANTLAGALLLLAAPLLVALASMRPPLNPAVRRVSLVLIGTIAFVWFYVFGVGAGGLLMLLFALLALLPVPRWALPAFVAFAATGCLYWSGSKGGWLLMLLLGLIVMLRLPWGARFKIILAGGILLAGLAGFFWKYSAFFRKGATSVVARFDYWEAAVRTAAAHPLFGTGPGTFSIPYQKIKRPESEMARLTHNDYLEQASDSGVPGFLAYLAFVVGALSCARVRAPVNWGRDNPSPLVTPGQKGGAEPSRPSAVGTRSTASLLFRPWVVGMRSTASLLFRPRTGKGDGRAEDWQTFAVWLGVLGWALQGLLEFGLYIPALAWPACALMGWLLGRAGNDVTEA